MKQGKSIQFTNWYLSPHRPLIPISKLTVSESYENYMSRSYQVTKDILSDCKNTGMRHSLESARSCWVCVGEFFFFTCSCVYPLLMLHPAWVSTLRRKQRADCSPRFFLRGLHTPAAKPRPTDRQGLHPSGPKGLLAAYLFLMWSILISFLFFFIQPTSLCVYHYFHLVSLPLFMLIVVQKHFSVQVKTHWVKNRVKNRGEALVIYY